LKRRDFFKTGVGLGSAALLTKNPVTLFGATQDAGWLESGILPGEQIPSEAFVQDKDLNPRTLIDLCQNNPDAKVIVLYIYGGAVLKHPKRLGGIWCPDSFEDLYILRFTYHKYKKAPVTFLPVACPPIYSSQYYGYEERVFLDEDEDSEKFKQSARAFIEKNEEIVASGLIPTETFYDVRFRLLFNRSEKWQPGEGYGTIYPWQGKFKPRAETQKYGTPTLWLLNREGVVLDQPFWGNMYH
jgi:hypothetical protein